MTERIWKCKIGGPAALLPAGCDYPMRESVARAFKEITGSDPEFIFSGWGAELTDGEREVVERHARPAQETPVVPVKNGYCTACGGIGEHYKHCLTNEGALPREL